MTNVADDPSDAPRAAAVPPAPGRMRAWVVLALVLLVALTAAFRAHAAWADPAFDARDPDGVLKSDPGLLHSLAARIVAADGAIPDDFAADRTLEHPDAIDVAERFPLWHLVAVANLHRLRPGDAPLHATAVMASACAMALALVGVFLLARELARSNRAALAAAALAAAVPGFHRSLGFVWLDEDFAWAPLLLHLGLAARAMRRPGAGAILLAMLPAALAFATWHAAGFFLTLEALVLLGFTLVRGASPLPRGPGALVPLVLAATALVVPFLRATDAVLSPAVALAAGAWAASWAPRGNPARVVLLVVAGGLAGAGAALGDGAHAHVLALLVAKLEHAGLRPPSAAGLPADVRLLWQGPFETPAPGHALVALSLAGVLGLAAALHALAGRGASRVTPAVRAAAWTFLAALAGAWFTERALVLPALLAPALVAWASTQVRGGARWLVVGVAAQAALGAAWWSSYENPWYHAPRERQAEIRWMVRAVDELVPAGEAIAADFVSSGAILAKGRHPIVVSPKWEAHEPRRRAAEFVDAFHHASPADFRRLLVERYRVRWLVVDRFTLQYLARWSAGLPPGSFDPLPGTAAAALLSRDDAALRSIPGYELVARSPSVGSADFYRIFRLTPP